MLEISDTEDDILVEALGNVEQTLLSVAPTSSIGSPCTSSDSGSIASGTTQPRNLRKNVPFFTLRGGRHLTVSDIAGQLWCEQQVEYKYKFPEVHVENVEKNPIVQKGSAIHHAKELEVHDIVTVKTHSREDKWAIELLNSYQQLLVLSSGCKIREFSIFGNLLKSGVVVKGVIDEIRYSPTGGLTVVELKTKAENREYLSKSRIKRDSLQVMLYKYLFENYDQSILNQEFLTSTFRLHQESELSEEVIAYAREFHLGCNTFGEIVNVLNNFIGLISLPAIDSLVIEYCSQSSGELLSSYNVPVDDDWLTETTNELLAYWLGQRNVRGVEIEEAYKCQHCPYSEQCTWRLAKQKEHEKSNRYNF